jgi:A/G-specific adenine glycosylase
MLQQTRTATATPYYQRFLARFPDVRALARARTDDVLAAWSGLGYYRRARNLHGAAQVVVREHKGRVPEDAEAFARLPGVGRYTLGAVLSIAFDRPLPVLDGNVARVLSRVSAVPLSYRDARGARALWALASSLVPKSGAGDWNQALMELGATVCLPTSPRCGECPIRRWCRAHAIGRVDEYPPRLAQPAPERVRRAIALIWREGRVLVRRIDASVNRGLWEPPGVELEPDDEARAPLARAVRALGVSSRLSPTGETIRHTIMQRSIAVEVWEGTTISRDEVGGARWITPGQSRLGITGLTRKALGLEAPRRPARKAAR